VAWREGSHDDLVLAVALACWYAERVPKPRSAGGERVFPRGPSRNGVDDWRAQERVQAEQIAGQMRAARAAGWRTR
jgi:hypothetical protein